jgi:hypothetical protein
LIGTGTGISYCLSNDSLCLIDYISVILDIVHCLENWMISSVLHVIGSDFGDILFQLESAYRELG